MEGVCETLDDQLTGNSGETGRPIDRVTEELNAKTKVLEIDLSRHVKNTDSDIKSLRQKLIQAKQQTNAVVSDKISACNSQIVAEKLEYQTKFLKVNNICC
jgi:septal ring factor EnvC (AmiA/AmiB activator)